MEAKLPWDLDVIARSLIYSKQKWSQNLATYDFGIREYFCQGLVA